MTEPSTTPPPNEHRSWISRHPLLTVFGVLLGLSVWYGFSSSGETAPPTTGDEFSAASMCEQFVEERLKSPSTAEFDSNATGGGDVWTVSGTVDSQNSFGGVVRNHYVCGLTYVGNDRWRLTSLDGLTN